MEVKEAAEVNTPDCHPRPLARAHEKRRERVAQEERQRYRDLLQSVWDEDRASRCETCYSEFTESDQSNYRRRGWDVQQSQKKTVSASAMLTRKFLRIRKVFVTWLLLAQEFLDNLENVRML